MISRQDLERLARLKSEHGILTVYIRLDPRLRFLRQQAASQFKGALKAAQRRIPERWREALERESSHVLDFLSAWEPTGRGLAIFSCRPEALWEILPLEVLVPNLVEYRYNHEDRRPYNGSGGVSPFRRGSAAKGQSTDLYR
jgi:hypothetical protein